MRIHHKSLKTSELTDHTQISVALVGTPNVGKHVIFNYLTGDSQTISTWSPGTIPKYEGKGHLNEYIFHIIDLPGVYSLGSESPEKRITRNYILNQNPEFIINIIDANQLERNLFLTLQLLSLGKPMLIAINQYDILKQRGFDIDFKKFEEIVGVPVLPTVGIHFRNVHQLLEKIIEFRKNKTGFGPKIFPYGKEIELLITDLSETFHTLIPTSQYPSRFAAIKLLKNDQDLIESLKSQAVNAEIQTQLLTKSKELRSEIQKLHGDSAVSVLDGELFSISNQIAQDITIIQEQTSKQKISHIMDHITLDPIWGYIFFAVIMGLLYVSVFSFGTWVSNIVDGWYDVWTPAAASKLGGEQGFWYRLIWIGIIGGFFLGVGGILPFLVPFYFFITLLQEVGYLPRAAYLMDSFMHRIGVHGTTIIPILLGFGCNVPAIALSSIMDTKEQKNRSIILSSLVPCSAVMTIVLGLVGKYLGLGYAFLLYGVVFFSIIILGKILTFRKFPDDAELIIELHDFQKPNWKLILKQTWFQSKEFIIIAIPLIMILGGVLQILMVLNLLDPINHFMSPVMVYWLGLPFGVGIYLFYGILRKELNLILLLIYVSSLGLLITEYMTPIQMIIFTLYTMLYVPCLATTITVKKETSTGFALGLFFLKLSIATVLVGVVRWIDVLLSILFPNLLDLIRIIVTFIVFYALMVVIIKALNLYIDRHQH